MANTNDMNTPTKVPCGGFVLGEGLALSKDGKTLNVTGGGSQADWNQNNETQPDYIKNRPFYETDPVETVMLPETTVTIAVGKPNIISESFPYSFEIGKTYTIIFDGVETEYTAYDGGSGAGYVGYDQQSISGGIGYFISSDGGMAALVTRDSAFVGQHTISIKSSLTEIVKIPDKYLNRHTHILGASFWESRSESELIEIVNQFNNGDVFVYQYDIGAAVLLLYASYSETVGFNFVYMYNYAIVKITGNVGNWTTQSATIAYS